MSLSIVTLASVKRHLRYPDPSAPHADDTSLLEYIAAADEVIEFECSDVLPHAYTEQHDGGDCSIFLRHLPVLSIQAVTESWGYMSFSLDFQASGSSGPWSVYAFSLDNPETGQITRRTAANVVIPFVPGAGNITVSYTTGRDPVPASIVLGEHELIAHWWRNSQQRSGSGGAGAASESAYDSVEGANYRQDPGIQNINIGVPYRILELIKGKRRMPFMA